MTLQLPGALGPAPRRLGLGPAAGPAERASGSLQHEPISPADRPGSRGLSRTAWNVRLRRKTPGGGGRQRGHRNTRSEMTASLPGAPPDPLGLCRNVRLASAAGPGRDGATSPSPAPEEAAGPGGGRRGDIHGHADRCCSPVPAGIARPGAGYNCFVFPSTPTQQTPAAKTAGSCRTGHYSAARARCAQPPRAHP